MRAKLHVFFLETFAKLPVWLRRRVVRTISPSYTVGAICLVERADDQILLVRQIYRRHWGLPGGLVERREDVTDAVRRELVEETGLVVDLVGEPAVVVDPESQRVDVVFRARPSAGVDPVAVAALSPEIAEVRWFARSDLPDLQPETTQALVALARSEVSQI